MGSETNMVLNSLTSPAAAKPTKLAQFVASHPGDGRISRHDPQMLSWFSLFKRDRPKAAPGVCKKCVLETKEGDLPSPPDRQAGWQRDRCHDHQCRKCGHLMPKQPWLAQGRRQKRQLRALLAIDGMKAPCLRRAERSIPEVLRGARLLARGIDGEGARQTIILDATERPR